MKQKHFELETVFSAVNILLLLAGYVALLFIYGIW